MAVTALVTMAIVWCFLHPILDILLTSYVHNIHLTCSSLVPKSIFTSFQHYCICSSKCKIMLPKIAMIAMIFRFQGPFQRYISDLFLLVLMTLIICIWNGTNNIASIYKDAQSSRRIMIAQRWHIITTFAKSQIGSFLAPFESTFLINLS